jgi:hypothetical protein
VGAGIHLRSTVQLQEQSHRLVKTRGSQLQFLLALVVVGSIPTGASRNHKPLRASW